MFYRLRLRLALLFLYGTDLEFYLRNAYRLKKGVMLGTETIQTGMEDKHE